MVLARESNDFLADAVERNLDRLSGFAALPTATPDKAAKKLERMGGSHMETWNVFLGSDSGIGKLVRLAIWLCVVDFFNRESHAVEPSYPQKRLAAGGR
jgi:hypothetical protein